MIIVTSAISAMYLFIEHKCKCEVINLRSGLAKTGESFENSRS